MFRLSLVALVVSTLACGSDADTVGVGAQCTGNDQCGTDQVCLPFKGGYCSITPCTGDGDCPTLSKCVTHTDGMNYCFRTCNEKAECNANRSAENEANCSSNVTFVDPATEQKACVPPS